MTVAADVGDVRVRIVRPVGVTRPLPAVLYMHGGGWILGNAATHDRPVRELAAGARAAVVFVEYDRSPEAAYPVAIEQGYATARWIGREGAAHGIDASRIAVAGDSVGGNMAAALALMAQQRGDVRFVHQSMYYPVTDGRMDTDSYREFATGYFLTAKAMEWFWDAYVPDVARRSEPFASPLRATPAQLADLPPAFIAVDEADVLRDEGEAYGAALRAAGVAVTTVRYDGITHDFMMLNPLSGTTPPAQRSRRPSPSSGEPWARPDPRAAVPPRTSASAPSARTRPRPFRGRAGDAHRCARAVPAPAAAARPGGQHVIDQLERQRRPVLEAGRACRASGFSAGPFPRVLIIEEPDLVASRRCSRLRRRSGSCCRSWPARCPRRRPRGARRWGHRRVWAMPPRRSARLGGDRAAAAA